MKTLFHAIVFALLLAPPAVAQEQVGARAARGPMSIQRTAVVHTSILVSPQDLVTFLRDMESWKSWAPWVQSVARLSANSWRVESDTGAMTFRFVEPNSLGVLDHDVTLESGATVFNAMRVVPNGDGSELVMIVFQRPQMSAEEFENDIQAVKADLERLKAAAEARSREAGR